MKERSGDGLSDREVHALLLDSWHKPVVFVDCGHVIRYMNAPARRHYARWGDVIGKSIFDCHNPGSGAIIREVFARLEGGADEALIVDSEKRRVYMRAVRDGAGTLVGYCERYEPPAGR